MSTKEIANKKTTKAAILSIAGTYKGRHLGLTAAEIRELLSGQKSIGVSQSSVSRYLSELKKEDLMETKAPGKWYKVEVAKIVPAKKVEEKKAPATVAQGVSEALKKNVAEKGSSKPAAKPIDKTAVEGMSELDKVKKQVNAILSKGRMANVREEWKETGEKNFVLRDQESIKVLCTRWGLALAEKMILVGWDVATYEPTEAKKAADKKTADKKTAKKTAPKKPADKKPRYTRANALAAVLLALGKGKGSNRDKLSISSNALYVKKGGKDNAKESRWFLNNSIGLLVDLDVIEIVHGENGEEVYTKFVARP